MYLIIAFFVVASVKSQYECDYDYGLRCLPGLPVGSYVLLNETSEEPRQPASDVTAIETNNDAGECFFPYQLASFDMFFCQRTDPDLPATCPVGSATGPRINCSEGDYGLETFDANETGVRSYVIDPFPSGLSGRHCFRFFYYLSDSISNGTIKVILENPQSNMNETIVEVSSRQENKWYQVRQTFTIPDDASKIFFEFERGSTSNSLPFSMAIDEITVTDVECEPIPTTTQETTTVITSSSTSSSTVSVTTPSSSSSTSTPSSSTISSTSSSTTLSSSTPTASVSSSVSISSTTSVVLPSSPLTSSTTTSPSMSSTSSDVSSTSTTTDSSSPKVRSSVFFVVVLLILLP